MTTILVADDAENVRELLVDILSDAGYHVIEAGNGGTAFEMARRDQPDIIVLDVIMPVMDGFEVLRRLRENPATSAIPVVLMTVLPAAEGEPIAMNLGVVHYITKPWEPGTVESAINVALREAGIATATVIRTGVALLDQKLGGGIPLRSLTLIEGASSAGKSVLCQHFAYGSVLDGHGVAFFTSENTANSLVRQMSSIGLDVLNHFRQGKLGIYPIEELAPEEAPEGLMASLALDIQGLPSQYKIIIVDSITNVASHSREQDVMAFFSSCKRLCNDGRTIIVVAHSFAFDEKMLVRLRSVCDTQLSLRIEKTSTKLLKILEVCKVHNAELDTGNVVRCEVEPGIGMRAVPIRTAKA